VANEPGAIKSRPYERGLAFPMIFSLSMQMWNIVGAYGMRKAEA
jgi:hypothetical protein